MLDFDCALLVSQLLKLWQRAGLTLVHCRLVQLSTGTAMDVARGEGHATALAVTKSADHLQTSPVLVVVLRGENAIGRSQAVAGPVDPQRARDVQPFSFRANFGTSLARAPGVVSMCRGDDDVAVTAVAGTDALRNALFVANSHEDALRLTHKLCPELFTPGSTTRDAIALEEASTNTWCVA